MILNELHEMKACLMANVFPETLCKRYTTLPGCTT